MNDLIKSFVSVFLILFVLIGVTSCVNREHKQDLLEKVKERGKLIAGVKYDSKPFGFIDSDQGLKGFDIDLVKEVAKRLLGDSDKVEFQQVTSANRIISLSSGTVDFVAATMTITDKRKRVIDFSRPYFVAGQVLMVRKDSDIKDLKDLNGKKVIVVLGSTSEKNIRKLAPKAQIMGFRTYTDAFSALRANRADALTTDDTIIVGFLSEDDRFKMLNERYTKEPYGLGFKKAKETKSFQNAVNQILDEMEEDGTLGRIKRKWMKIQ